MDSEEVAGQSEMVTIIPNGKHNEDLTMPVKTPPEDDGYVTFVSQCGTPKANLLQRRSGTNDNAALLSVLTGSHL